MLRERQAFLDGKPHGEWHAYSREGRLLGTWFYDDGWLVAGQGAPPSWRAVGRNAAEPIAASNPEQPSPALVESVEHAVVRHAVIAQEEVPTVRTEIAERTRGGDTREPWHVGTMAAQYGLGLGGGLMLGLSTLFIGANVGNAACARTAMDCKFGVTATFGAAGAIAGISVGTYLGGQWMGLKSGTYLAALGGGSPTRE